MNKRDITLMIVLAVSCALALLIGGKNSWLIREKNELNVNTVLNENKVFKEEEKEILNSEENNQEENNEKSEYSHINKLNLNKLEEKLKKKDSFILILTGTTCPHCLSYKPVLNEVLEEYDLEAYELDVWALTSEERTRFNELLEIEYVPTTMFIVKGEENKDERKVGNILKEDIISYLKENNYI